MPYIFRSLTLNRNTGILKHGTGQAGLQGLLTALFQEGPVRRLLWRPIWAAKQGQAPAAVFQSCTLILYY